MNVIVVYDYGEYNGGAAQVALSSAITLKRNGVNVIYFCAVGPITKELEENGIEVICLNQYNILEDPNFFGKIIRGIWNIEARNTLRQLLKRFSSEDTIVHFHGWSKALSPSVVGLPSKMGFKTCVTLHDFFTYCPNGGLYNFRAQKICSLIPMTKECIFCNCDKRSYTQKLWRILRQIVQNFELKRMHDLNYISISAVTFREFKRCYHYKFHNIHTIYNPVEFPRDKVEMSGDYYLFMGRLSREKGLELFCQAITELGLKGVCLGDGALKEEMSVKYPNIEFVGWVSGEEKRKYFAKTKAFVFSSVCLETFGLSVAELLSMGIPCVVGDSTAAAEMIRHGENGYLFKTGDLDSLKIVLRNVESGKDNLRGFLYDKDRYSIESHIKYLLKEYKDILEQ